jgi:lipoic acid synthetase
MGLRHAVVTSVTRDDLPDHGAAHWAAVVAAIRKANPRTTIELLIPDMRGRREFVEIVAASKPDITGHNIECVRRLTGEVRSRASYRTSLHTLEHIAAAGTTTKSGLMVGLGETDNEVLQTLADLRRAGCRIVTIGQYLRPTPRHMAVSRYVHPEQFDLWREAALAMGFSYVAAGPLVRSSYMAEEALGCI